MKNNGVYLFLGCCVLAIAIYASSIYIADRLPDTTQVPNKVLIQNVDEKVSYGDYLTFYDAATYLGIADDELSQIIDSGQLDSAFYKIGDSYIFSKKALQAWAESKVAE